MGAGCSTEKSVDSPSAQATRAKSASLGQPTRAKSTTLGKSPSNNASRKTREELAKQFVAEFPADEDPEDVPTYPDGSREATLLKIFNLLDKDTNRGYIDVPTWKEYAVGAGLTTEALGRELPRIIAQQSQPGDPRVSPLQFVTAMVRIMADFDDQDFGRFVAQTLVAYRAKGASRFLSAGQVQQSGSQVTVFQAQTSESQVPSPAPPPAGQAPSRAAQSQGLAPLQAQQSEGEMASQSQLSDREVGPPRGQQSEGRASPQA